MSGTAFYATTLLVYLGVDIMACWSLNLQFGVAGIVNFAFIVFQAAGAYTAAVLTLGPPTANGGFQHFFAGTSLPFPLPLLAAAVVGALLALVVGVVGLRRLRGDYQAMVFLVVAIIATKSVESDIGFLNGSAGLSLVPQPLASSLGTSPVDYQWFYVGLTAAICAIAYFFVHRVTGSPLGRTLRAIRENEHAASALGKNVHSLRVRTFMMGGAIAAVSGAVLVEFIGAWAPGSWLYVETFVILTAIIVGGSGNNFGVMVGALLVPVAFVESTRYLPEFGRPGLVDALGWMIIGALALVFLWFRPSGIFPERKRRFEGTGTARKPIGLPNRAKALR